MKKFGEYITETLAAEVKSPPKTKAAAEARRLGLTYMGFGRYADKTGKYAYVVHNDMLVPARKAKASWDTWDKANIKPTTEKEKIAADNAKAEWKQSYAIEKGVGDRDRAIVKQKQDEIQKTAKALYNFYQQQTFDNDELQALDTYTSEGFEEINRYLYKGHDEGTDGQKSAYIENTIDMLDSAFEGTEAPFSYTVYTGLSKRYNAQNFKKNMEYIFRGYVSTSLDYHTALNVFGDSGILLQVDVKKGQKSIYVDGVSTHEGELETLLPRGSRIRVISGPHPIHAEALENPDSDVEPNYSIETVMLFHCELIEDK